MILQYLTKRRFKTFWKDKNYKAQAGGEFMVYRSVSKTLIQGDSTLGIHFLERKKYKVDIKLILSFIWIGSLS